MVKLFNLRKLLTYLVLSILPAVFIIIGLNFNRAHFSSDPEYAYLFNGLNIAYFKSVGHFDHPGSTVQMWNAALMRINHFIDPSAKSTLEDDVLNNPDHYIGLLIHSTILLNSLLFFTLGLIALRRYNNLWYALILQLTPFLSTNVLEQAWTKLSPEPFLIAAVSLFLIVFILYYTAEKKDNFRYAVYFALVIAFGIATKVTFLPLFVIPLLILEKIWNKLIFSLICIPAFILFTLPALPAYRLMFKWFIGLGTHTGTYGQGNKGIIDPAQFLQNISAIIKNNISFSITIIMAGVLLLFLLFARKRRTLTSSHLLKYTLALFLTQILGILLVAKHYHMNHYLIPELCLTGITWIFLLMMIRETYASAPLFDIGSNITIIIGMAAMIFLNIPYLTLANHYYRLTNEEYVNTQNLIAKKYSGFTLIDNYPYSINPANALFWGNVYSRNIHTQSLKSLYQDQPFYDLYMGSFTIWGKPISAKELLEKFGPKLLIVGGPISQEQLIKMKEDHIELIPIQQGRTQSIYQIDPSSPAFINDNLQKPINTVCFSLDSISKDQRYYIAGTEKIDFDHKQSPETSHSGRYSIKLSGTDLYGLPYRLTNVNAGDEYRIGVWRKGDNKNTFLVAAGEIPEQFYIQESDFVKGNVQDWNYISFNFTIPQSLSKSLIKIYVWNNSGKTAYFDDLTVSRIK